MLLEAAYKIVANLLHERLLSIAETIDESQCAFRPGEVFSEWHNTHSQMYNRC